MREAAAICKGKADWIMGRQEGPQEELSNVIVRHHASAHFAAHDAILAAIRSPSAAKENIERRPCDCEYPDAERKWHFIPGVGIVVTCQRLENCECSRRKGDLP